VKKKFQSRPRLSAPAHCATKEDMMTPTPEQVAVHMARFLDMLDAAFRRYGVPDGLPERFRNAVAATPRHMFVHVSDAPKLFLV
jgi:hypothetical protein